MKNLSIVLVCVAMAVVGFTTGVVLYSDNATTENVTEIIYVDVPGPERIVIQERIIEKTQTIREVVQVENTVYKNHTWHEFGSVQDVKDWYAKQGFEVLLPSGKYKVDCDNYALWVQRVAFAQGYYSVSLALAQDGMYYGVKVTDKKNGHCGNLVLVTDPEPNEFYWLEPDPRVFELVKVVNQD